MAESKLLELKSEVELTEECATTILEVVPVVMRNLRNEMRRYRPAGMSVPQFRALSFVRRNPNTSLSAVAEHLGLTLPSVSTMVDGLQERNYLRRETDPHDRRKLILNLTDHGQAVLKAVWEATLSQIGERLEELSPGQKQAITEALELLRHLFEFEENGSEKGNSCPRLKVEEN